MTKQILYQPKGQANSILIRWPLKIAYPDHLPYALPAGQEVERDARNRRVIITYASPAELRACLEIHKEAQELAQSLTPMGQKGFTL